MPGAAAIACYADSDRDLDRIIDEETRRAGLTITAEARTALKAMLGADRMASRSEVAKLCLYAADAGSIALDDVRAIIGDAAASAVDEVIDAAALGDAAGLDRAYRRLRAAGVSGCGGRRRRPAPFQLPAEGTRRLRCRRDGRRRGRPRQPAGLLPAAQRRHPPAWHVERRASETALTRLDTALLESRLHAAIADDVVGQALQSVAYMAAATARR